MDTGGTSYLRREHRARYTDNYVFSQLIPYIGNKRKLLPLIGRALRATGLSGETFVDLFTGSTVVARWAKTMGCRVLANDWEPYSHEIALGTVVPDRPPTFARLGGLERAFARLSASRPRTGWVSRHLCPRDDAAPDPERERMFFTRANGRRIDAVRETIAEWEAAGDLDVIERAYLLSALIYAACYASNTSGVFKGFHHGWGGRTGSALYRILAPLELRPPVLHDNSRENLALREDARLLAPRLKGLLGRTPDVVYLDPPYNQHPYGSNYHVLNSLALWDKPPLSTVHRTNGRSVDKAAIRRDWRTARRSAYNHRREAPAALRDLLSRLDARWLLLSYSTDGMIPTGVLLEILCERGRLELFHERYKRYRVSTQRWSPRPHTVEFVALVDTAGRSRVSRVPRLLESLAAGSTAR